jgi:hypothetical protein
MHEHSSCPCDYIDVRRHVVTRISAPLLLLDLLSASHEIKESASNEREHIITVALFVMKIVDTHYAMKLCENGST